MKKLFLILLLINGFTGAKANIAPPQAYISEILIDSAGNWSIEMGFFDFNMAEIDSIRLETSMGSSIITSYYLIPGGANTPFDSLSVITVANLENPVLIDPQGDYVKLISYLWSGNQEYNFSAFGDYPGSFLDCIHEGESVLYSYAPYMDSSPTIGSGNDDGFGYTGIFSGIVLDLEGNPFSGVSVIPYNKYPHGMVLHPDTSGLFSNETVCARFTFDTIKVRFPPWPYTEFLYTCETVDFCLRPDSSYYQDIITTSLIMDIDKKDEPQGRSVTVAPNPFSDHVVFYFNLNNKHDNDLIFSIYSLDGRILEEIKLAPGQNRFEWRPSMKIPGGTYIYRLQQNNHTLKTGKFVRL